jgi:hypothetical protein
LTSLLKIIIVGESDYMLGKNSIKEHLDVVHIYPIRNHLCFDAVWSLSHFSSGTFLSLWFQQVSQVLHFFSSYFPVKDLATCL